MKTRILSTLLLTVMAVCAMAQSVTVTWTLGDVNQLSAATMTGDNAGTLLTTTYAQGNKIAKVETLAKSGADTGYSAVDYSPAFASYTPATKVSAATAGHDVTFTLKPTAGHTLKVTRISFDCVKVGTDGGAIDAVATLLGSGKKTTLAPVDILRNKIQQGNSKGYAHNEYNIADMVVDESGLSLAFFLYNINGTDSESPKALGLRNIVIEGVMDEAVFDVSHYLAGLTCMGTNGIDAPHQIDLYNLVKGLKNGQSARYSEKLFGKPTDFNFTLQPELAEDYFVDDSYNSSTNTLNVVFYNTIDFLPEFQFSLSFSVTNSKPKGQPVALKRGLMALRISGGNLVSWRSRKSDTRNYKFRLWRGNSATSQTEEVNYGDCIVGKTNYLDNEGSSVSYYRLEVIDEQGRVVETDVSGQTWSNQTKYLTLQGGAPTDPTSAGATYTPNDASFCDMDGDGEYDIVLKWAPSNEKDAASSGTTSPAFYACYHLDGTRLWMLHTGANMFNSAHTTPFVAWDLDGDGYGEFMVKTAPGAIDGEGNYVVMDGDDPNASLKSGRGKQDHGSEYITVFDGTTGAELKTIKYHTAYGDVSTSFWGDSKQNRSERYLAAIAWLDGEDHNPSAIFARGYYNGARIGAYDWDGENLTLRWLHSADTKTSGTVTYADGTVKKLTSTVYGEGAHWISIGDVNGDGRQEIHYGSGALKPDGTTLYRTGLGHGDAIHLGDFIPSRPGQEYFMAHEEKSDNGNYGVDLRDAKTGEILVRRTAASDTGRGLIGHFNPEADNAYFFNSADASKDASGNALYMLFDTDGNQVSNIGFGSSGAAANNRIFWNGTLADDFFDKSIICQFNPASKGFDRMKVNGGNYTVGNLNNASKNNPCVLGDLLGDWREEIVTWTASGGNYQLIINATDYQTDYIFPHLMDDYAYRAQVISQNCAYNQPPHVSYDPRTAKTITPRTIEVEPTTEGSKKLGRYWGTLYTSYPVYIPSDVTAWGLSSYTGNETDTLRLTRLAPGKIVGKGRGIVFCSNNSAPKFVPTSLTANVTPVTTYLKGSYCDSLVTDPSNYQYAYELRNGQRGIGFYRTHGKSVVNGGEAFALFGTSAKPGAEAYVLGEWLNALSSNKAGDVNGDERVDIADAVAIEGYMSGKKGVTSKQADTDGNGKVTHEDIVRTLQIIGK